MPLETGTYISDLVSTNPAGTDTIDRADDHLRLIKSTVKATFPNAAGPIGFSSAGSSGAAILSVTDNTNAALRITQLGTGPAIRVEDETSPDSTPFIVDANGNVGVGMTPVYKLDLNGGFRKYDASAGAYNVLVMENNGGAQVQVGVNSSQGELRTATNSPLVFLTNNFERMRIDASGNVGIGTSSPTFQFGGGVQVRNGTEAAVRVSGGTSTGFDLVQGGDGTGYLALRDNKPLTILTNNAERMRIDGLGRIFVAGASMDWGGGGNIVMPDSSSFSFNGTTGHFVTNMYYNGVWRMNSNAAGALYVQGVGAHLWYNAPAGSAGSQAGLTERMNLAADGTLRVGSSSAASAPFSAFVPVGNIGYWVLNHPTGTGSGNWYYSFQLGGTTIGTITQSGTTGVAYNTTSDYRLKENVVPLSGASERILALKPSRFNFKEEPDRTVDGFIAHEAQEVVPEAVTGEKDAVDAEGNPVYQGIDQSKLVPLLTAALQEALTEISSLKARVAALEAA